MSLTKVQLDNPGDFWANVAKTVLLADSPAWPFTPYAHRYLGAMDNNRVQIQATGFAPASDHMDFANIANVATPFFNHYKGRLAFDVVGSRADQAATDNFAYCIGRLGTLCRRDQQKFTPSTCSGLAVIALDAVDMGNATEDEKTDKDHSTVAFDIEYIIPAAVYAAAT